MVVIALMGKIVDVMITLMGKMVDVMIALMGKMVDVMITLMGKMVDVMIALMGKMVECYDGAKGWLSAWDGTTSKKRVLVRTGVMLSQCVKGLASTLQEVNGRGVYVWICDK